MCGYKGKRAIAVAGMAVSLAVLGFVSGCEQIYPIIEQVTAWTRHTIDSGLSGADGVKLADANGDGLYDLVVPWEQSGEVVVYLNPGVTMAAAQWPSVTVGEVGDVEDAVLVDLDEDGSLDAISCCQGDVRTMYIHWAPSDASDYVDSAAWRTEAIPATAGQRKWLYCQPARIDDANGFDLIAGAKGDDGAIGILFSPANARDEASWSWRKLADATWIMSIIPFDMDYDGDIDIIYSDRKGDARGCYWLENPGTDVAATHTWQRYLIGTSASELMFMEIGDPEGDGLPDLFVATNQREVLRFSSLSNPRLPWFPSTITWSDSFGTGKSVRLGDLDLDGSLDLVFTCENAGDLRGVGRLSQQDLGGLAVWTSSIISDQRGAKFDIAQLLDMDGDGDLDVITTEESAGLGVVWYENPAIGD